MFTELRFNVNTTNVLLGCVSQILDFMIRVLCVYFVTLFESHINSIHNNRVYTVYVFNANTSLLLCISPSPQSNFEPARIYNDRTKLYSHVLEHWSYT